MFRSRGSSTPNWRRGSGDGSSMRDPIENLGVDESERDILREMSRGSDRSGDSYGRGADRGEGYRGYRQQQNENDDYSMGNSYSSRESYRPYHSSSNASTFPYNRYNNPTPLDQQYANMQNMQLSGEDDGELDYKSTPVEMKSEFERLADEGDDLLFGPEWLTKKNNSGFSSSSSSLPVNTARFDTIDGKPIVKFNRKQLLDIYKPNTTLPSALLAFSAITSEESLQPMGFLPVEMREEAAIKFYANRGRVERGGIERGRSASGELSGMMDPRSGNQIVSSGSGTLGGPGYGTRSPSIRGRGRGGITSSLSRGGSREAGGRSWDTLERGSSRDFSGSGPIPSSVERRASLRKDRETFGSLVDEKDYDFEGAMNNMNMMDERERREFSMSRDRERDPRGDREMSRDKYSLDNSGSSGNFGSIRPSLSSSANSVMMKPNPTPSPSLSPKDLLWLYKDPQGEVQGPFTDNEMNEWFEAGYFATSLLVKRVHESNFTELGSMLSNSDGATPFTTPSTLTSATSSTSSASDPLVLLKDKFELKENVHIGSSLSKSDTGIKFGEISLSKSKNQEQEPVFSMQHEDEILGEKYGISKKTPDVPLTTSALANITNPNINTPPVTQKSAWGNNNAWVQNHHQQQAQQAQQQQQQPHPVHQHPHQQIPQHMQSPYQQSPQMHPHHQHPHQQLPFQPPLPPPIHPQLQHYQQQPMHPMYHDHMHPQFIHPQHIHQLQQQHHQQQLQHQQQVQQQFQLYQQQQQMHPHQPIHQHQQVHPQFHPNQQIPPHMIPQQPLHPQQIQQQPIQHQPPQQQNQPQVNQPQQQQSQPLKRKEGVFVLDEKGNMVLVPSNESNNQVTPQPQPIPSHLNEFPTLNSPTIQQQQHHQQQLQQQATQSVWGNRAKIVAETIQHQPPHEVHQQQPSIDIIEDDVEEKNEDMFWETGADVTKEQLNQQHEIPPTATTTGTLTAAQEKRLKKKQQKKQQQEQLKANQAVLNNIPGALPTVQTTPVLSLREIQDQELKEKKSSQQQPMVQQVTKKKDDKASPWEQKKDSGLSLREIQEQEMKELRKKQEKEEEEARLREKERALYQQQNKTGWSGIANASSGNSNTPVWSNSPSEPRKLSLKEIQDQELKQRTQSEVSITPGSYVNTVSPTPTMWNRPEQSKPVSMSSIIQEQSGLISPNKNDKGKKTPPPQQQQPQSIINANIATSNMYASIEKEQPIITTNSKKGKDTNGVKKVDSPKKQAQAPVQTQTPDKNKKKTTTTGQSSVWGASTNTAKQTAVESDGFPTLSSSSSKDVSKNSDESMFWEVAETNTPKKSQTPQPQQKVQAPVKQTKPQEQHKIPEADFPSLMTVTKKDDSVKQQQELLAWTVSQLKPIAGNRDKSLADRLVNIKSPNEVKQFAKANIGSSDAANKFVENYIKRKFSPSSEPTSTPSPQVAQQKPVVQTPQPQPSSKKEKKKGKPIDPTLLGFSVNSTQRVMGEIQTLDD